MVDGEGFDVARPAPALGQHTREVLLEIGYAEHEVDDMMARGTAG